MILQSQYICLHATSLNQEGISLYATTSIDNKTVDIEENWADWAFLWHQSSYYGTRLKKKMVGSRLYVLLSHVEAYEFFLTLPMNPWIAFTFDEACQSYINSAKEIAGHIQSDTIFPRISSTEAGESILDWETEDDEHPYWAEWFQNIARAACTQSNYYNKIAKLSKYGQAYLSHTLFGVEDNDEERFYQNTGWKPKEHSYQLALQLVEPEKSTEKITPDGEPISSELWTLQVVIRSSALPDAPWTPYNPNKPEAYLQERDQKGILTRLQVWQQYAPFIGQVSQQTMDTRHLSIGRSLSEDEAFTFLMEVAPTLVKHNITVLLPIWWKDIQKKKWTLQATVGKAADQSTMPLVWRDFEWRLALGDNVFSEAEFIEALQAGRRMIQVGKEWMLLDERTLKDIQTYVRTAKKKGFNLRDMIVQEGRRMQEYEAALGTVSDDAESFHVEIQATPIWHRTFRKLFEQKDWDEIPLGEAFHGELRDYQQVAVNWLCDRYNRQLGAILADDMGLGKTIMVIGYFLSIRQRTQAPASCSKQKNPQATEQINKGKHTAPILLICPTSLLGNWEMELQKFAPDLKVITHYGVTREKEDDLFTKQITEADLILTSYGLIANDFELLQRYTWQSIVLDEAQNIKNHATKQSRAIRDLISIHRIALTGTPVENRLMELWTIFDFIQPDYLGSLAQFKREYILPIEAEQNEQKQQALKVLIQPFLLRRTKKDKKIRLDLPDKLEQKSFLHLNVEQTALYYQLVEQCKAERTESSSIRQKGLILAALNHFKMICDHPALYLQETTNHNWLERSPKLTHCMELVENILEQGEHVLIFTQYLDMAKIIQFALKKRFDILTPFFHGSLSKSARDKLVTEFQNGVYPVLILSLKAGGTGLTLTRANHVIHYDRWWNPAVENQATDRVHRIGQENFVHVHKLIMKGTIEEKIDVIMDKKQDLSEQILSPESWLSQMSFDEFLRMVL